MSDENFYKKGKEAVDIKINYDKILSRIEKISNEWNEKIEKLAIEYGVDEIMIVNVTYSFEDRIKSYELLSNEFNLKN